MANARSFSRRRFIRGAAAAVAAPQVITTAALGQGDRPPASERVAMGFIGVGSRGTGVMKGILSHQAAQAVAVCDVDVRHREAALRACSLTPSAGYNDFRDLLARDDVDAVMIATPDFWHGVMCCAAARTGKDIYCEKPLSLTVPQGRAIADAADRYGRVFQTGTQRRSMSVCRRCAEMVQSGYVGTLRRIDVRIPGGYWVNPAPSVKYGHPVWDTLPRNRWTPFETFTHDMKSAPVPEGLDYDLWLGPAPWRPYMPALSHRNWRWILDYGGGFITDWGAHYLDVAQWGHGTDDTGPVEVEGTGWAPTEGIYNTPATFNVRYAWADGVKMTLATVPDMGQVTTRFVGTEGELWVAGNALRSKPESIAARPPGENDVRLVQSDHHQHNFVDSVLDRRPAVAPAETGHRAISIAHIGLISIRLGGRRLRWDPEAEQFVGDDAANRMLNRAMRGPWHL
ncbi:MAG: Gfo/Idh/MocA family protein [Planctomycetota bacterium]|jgi:predicted dehydrogenase